MHQSDITIHHERELQETRWIWDEKDTTQLLHQDRNLIQGSTRSSEHTKLQLIVFLK